MICKNCGNECGDAKFCPNCGTKMTENNNSQEQNYGSYHQNQYSQQGQYGQNPYGQNPYGQGPYGQNPYGQNPYGNPDPYWQHSNMYRPPVIPGKGMGIASMVLGIIALVIMDFALVLGILAIIFGSISKGKGYRGASATAGISCGIIAVVFFVCLIILVSYGFALI